MSGGQLLACAPGQPGTAPCAAQRCMQPSAVCSRALKPRLMLPAINSQGQHEADVPHPAEQGVKLCHVPGRHGRRGGRDSKVADHRAVSGRAADQMAAGLLLGAPLGEAPGARPFCNMFPEPTPARAQLQQAAACLLRAHSHTTHTLNAQTAASGWCLMARLRSRSTARRWRCQPTTMHTSRPRQRSS